MSGEVQVPWHRYALISELARRLHEDSPWFGKTALQKIVYLLQELGGVPAGYEYRLHTHGPFAARIHADLDQLETFRAVTLKYVSGEGFGGYKISPGPHNQAICERGVEFLLRNQESLDAVLDDFGSLSTRDLELRSTVAFVQKRPLSGDRLPNREQLVTQVGKIKPRFSHEEILAAVNELDQKGYIRISDNSRFS